ncbi:MAG: TRAP transporter substrate-binding protein DctP, partial [Oscillospiraceae bacterium]|nr:TRAP transporter substrate-binding protein DctP [Oscillospiraceae bacterium]
SVGGVFPIAEFCNVPLNGITCAQMGSKVFYDMYNEIPECAAEFKDFKVIEVQCCSTAPLSTVGFKIEKPEDFNGKSFRAAGAVQSTYLQLLGSAPSSIPPGDVYESMEKHVVSGMTNDWHNIDCFKLYEVTDYCMDYPINTTSCFLLMNKEKYESLPEDLQKLIDSYAQYASDMAGYYWDCMFTITGDKMKENGVEIYKPSQEVYDYMASAENQAAMKDWYINYLTEKGYSDAQGIWDKCIEIVGRYAADYVDPFAAELKLESWDKASISNYNK